MKKVMKYSLLLALALWSQLSLAATDSEGEQCEAKVARVARTYFEVADTSSKVNFAVGKSDILKVQSFKNITPGTYNQEYVADVKVQFDARNKWAPEKSQKIRMKMTGEFDCDNLKVKNLKYLGEENGGVERVE